MSHTADIKTLRVERRYSVTSNRLLGFAIGNKEDNLYCAWDRFTVNITGLLCIQYIYMAMK